MTLRSALKKKEPTTGDAGEQQPDQGVSVTEEDKAAATNIISNMAAPLAKRADLVLTKKHKQKKKRKNEKDAEAEVQSIDVAAKKTKTTKEDDVDQQPETSDDTAQALEYLRLWKKDNQNWKFQKKKQVYLLRHIYNPTKIDKRHFKWLTKYLVNLQGAAREHSHAYAKRAVESEQFRQGVIAGFGRDDNDGTDSTKEELLEEVERRAVKLLQVLG